MTLEQLLEQGRTAQAPLAELTTIAGARASFGDDVEAVFRAQAELRATAALALTTTAQEAGRDLLASEARDVDRLVRERDAVLGLLRHVEQRTGAAYRVPASQATEPRTDDDLSPVLTREQPVRAYLSRRGGARYAGDPGRLRFGALVRALALGNRDGLSPLEQRALSEGTDSAGGYTVPEIVATQFIDRMRAAMVVMRAGALTVPMTSDVLHIARLGQPDSVSPTLTGPTWKTENDPIAENDLVLERVTFTARTLPMLLKLSVELSEDSANIDAIVETELSRAMAVELDRVALLGSGTPPEPRGVRNQSGVGVTSFGSLTPSNYDHVIDAIGRVWSSNHEPTARIGNAAYSTMLAKLKSSADDQPLRVPDVVTAVTALRTQQIPMAGTSPDTTTLVVGDFSQLLIGLRTSFRLEVSRVAAESFEKLQIAVRAYLRADVQLAHPEAFDVTTLVGTN